MRVDRFHKASWLVLLLVLCGALGSNAAVTGFRGAGVAAVVRTIAYHQITTLSGPIHAGGQTAPIICANGNRVAFATPAGAPPDDKNHIFVINADGTGQREVDAYTPFCFCSTMIDVSANGGRVVSSDAVQIKIVNSDGSGKRSLVALDSNEINAIAISDDGSKVYFRVYRSTSVRGSNPSIPFPNGIYVINADGTGLRQIVGRSNMSALLGRPVTDFDFFGANGNATLDVSADGSRIAFATIVVNEGGRIMGVNLDGTNLHTIVGPDAFVSQVGISGDGTKVGFDVIRVSDNRNEVGAINFDGSGRVFLTDDAVDPTNRIDSGDRITLNTDGSKLLLGSAGVLHNTDGTGKFSLTSRGGNFTTDILPLLSDTFPRATMNAAGNRFLFLATFGNDSVSFNSLKNQLAIADLNGSLGVSPVITNPIVDPPFVVRSQTTTTASAKVTTSLVLNRVSNGALFNGVNARGNIGNVLLDNGTAGDVTANDKTFTQNGIFANGDAALGPHTFRFKAEARTTSGLRHASVIDIEPFEVLGTPPTPDILRLHPKQARRGSKLVNMAIEGINFFNNSSVRFLLNGAADAKVTVSGLSVVNAGKIVLTADIAGDATLGDRVVQVTNIGGTSTATANANNTFTITDLPDPADTEPPALVETNTTPTTLPPAGGDVTFTAKVSDNKSIGSVSAEVTRPNGNTTTVALALQNGGPSIAGVTGTFSGKFTAPANSGQTNHVYRVAFFAKDSANNQAGPVRGESFIVGGTVPDTDPPAISNNTVDPAEFERAGGTANFAVTVKDNVDVASAIVRITKPDSTTQDVNLTRLQGSSSVAGVTVRFTGSFNAPANTTTRDKRYKTNFIARDSAGNETRSNGETIVVHGFNDPPNIVSVALKPTNLPATGGKVSFSATVESGDANVKVLVQVFGSGVSEIARTTLTRTSGNSFSGSARIPANNKKKSVTYAAVITATDVIGEDGPKPVGSITVAKKRR